VNFPKAKRFTHIHELKLDGGLEFHATVKEALLEEMEAPAAGCGE